MADGAELARMIAASRVIDLLVTTGTDLPCSPPEGQPPAQFLLNTYTWPSGPFLEYVQVHDDHTGTHIDAPAHFTPAPGTGLPHATEHGGVTIEQLPLEQLMGPCGSGRTSTGHSNRARSSCSARAGRTATTGRFPAASATTARTLRPARTRSSSSTSAASATSASTPAGSA